VMSGDSVCAVARRHGLSPQQLFGWRQQARQLACDGEKGAPSFVPAIVETAIEGPPPVGTSKSRDHKPRRGAEESFGVIEVTIDSVTVRVGRGADAKTISAVLRALKAAP
jgi:transposase